MTLTLSINVLVIQLCRNILRESASFVQFYIKLQYHISSRLIIIECTHNNGRCNMPKHQSFCWYSERPFPRPLVDKLQMHPYINPLSMKNTSDIYQPLRSRQSQSSGILKEMICTLNYLFTRAKAVKCPLKALLLLTKKTYI